MIDLLEYLRTDEVFMAALSLGMSVDGAFDRSERYCLMLEAGASHEAAISAIFGDAA